MFPSPSDSPVGVEGKGLPGGRDASDRAQVGRWSHDVTAGAPRDHQRRPAEPAARHRPGRDRRVARVAGRGRRPRRAQPGALPDAEPAAAGPREAGRRARACAAPTTSTRSRPRREPWFPGDEHVERRIRAYIRWNAAIMVHRAQRPGVERRRAHLDLRLVGEPLRGRLQPLLPRQGPPRRRRPDLLPGPRLPRHVRPGVPRGPPDRAASSTASARSSRTRAAACRRTRTRG